MADVMTEEELAVEARPARSRQMMVRLTLGPQGLSPKMEWLKTDLFNKGLAHPKTSKSDRKASCKLLAEWIARDWPKRKLGWHR